MFKYITFNVDILTAIISLALMTLGFFIRLERRLTRIETTLDLHCKGEAKHPTRNKNTPYPI